MRILTLTLPRSGVLFVVVFGVFFVGVLFWFLLSNLIDQKE